ncbi:MAG: response regulator transcription factor [Lachnospiraceae bacterium]|nr:response regulator transcription factor [Lachnospiraceae bacterium]
MYKILIADDEELIRQGIKCLCDYESLGFTIVGEAANGDQAYKQIMDLNPDIVLMDIRMPGMTGLEVIEKLNEIDFKGKFVIISSFTDFSYAQQAIRLGVQNYITKPIDEDELVEILKKQKELLDSDQITKIAANHYKDKAHSAIIKDILLGTADLNHVNLKELNLDADSYQVVIYEKYSYDTQDASYDFADLLRVTNTANNSFDRITIDNCEVLLLKGQFAIGKFNDFLERYTREKRPQKNSPLDSLFITYGSCVSTLEQIPTSFKEAESLLRRRFFCDQEQHTIGYDSLPSFAGNTSIINENLLNEYTTLLLNYIQTFNRNMVAETLDSLQTKLYNASDSLESIKLFLTDLYLQIKEQIKHLYPNNEIPFASNSIIIRTIEEKLFLYEIILYFTEQFEIIMSFIGSSTRDSVLDDILHYINHNYTKNITLENIAPLFGYNSSYLGKIFNKKVGENFNSYVDHIRIEHSKELLLNDNAKVYAIAEKVGYRSVDYFHIKFKKYVGQSPAEFRKKNRTT